jgi:hypothetical protein
MKIHPLQTGTVRVKNSFLHPSPGRRRQLDLFLPGAWSEPLPGDHADGVVHVSAPVRVNDVERQFAATPFSRLMRRVLRQPLPHGFAPEPSRSITVASAPSRAAIR